jgi:hypothetical protein
MSIHAVSPLSIFPIAPPFSHNQDLREDLREARQPIPALNLSIHRIVLPI